MTIVSSVAQCCLVAVQHGGDLELAAGQAGRHLQPGHEEAVLVLGHRGRGGGRLAQQQLLLLTHPE